MKKITNHNMNRAKYKPFQPIIMPDRGWPEKQTTKAPRWCSVDLRDGNQALITPMNIEQKKNMFNQLVNIGFKEIEVGFPSASQVEHDFLRDLIENNLIPKNVTVQALTQAREHLIEKTCQSLRSIRRAVIHMYNSTSELQRRVVFNMDKREVIALAVRGTKCIKKFSKQYLSDSEISFEYSPESFTGTELEFAVEICEAVFEAWKPAPSEKIIFNLPSTVEGSTPNIFADQIEWFCRHFKYRDRAIISLHCHNDRGTAVAATELGLLAGADRVEGTLFGNGERTGNADIINLALNMFSQGIDPKLDISNIPAILNVYKECTNLPVHERHPYAGELVFTAFSGSHQDAINKGLKARQKSKNKLWEVPYLPIDPADVGRKYEALIRINSQSGKGGVAFVMENDFGFRLPKAIQPDFAKIIQKISDDTGREVAPQIILQTFEKEYVNLTNPIEFIGFRMRACHCQEKDAATSIVHATIKHNGQLCQLSGEGNGPVDAFYRAWQEKGFKFTLVSYDEHALEKGADARAAAYIQIADNRGQHHFGVGVDHNIVGASLKALVSAINKSSARE